MFAAGELAMTALDLAMWDISMIEQTVLKPESYRALETETLLAQRRRARATASASRCACREDIA